MKKICVFEFRCSDSDHSPHIAPVCRPAQNSFGSSWRIRGQAAVLAASDPPVRSFVPGVAVFVFETAAWF